MWRPIACEQAPYLGDIVVKSGRARGTREETRRRGQGRGSGPARIASLAQIGELAHMLDAHGH